jgi:exodeoxyribonuclease V alpha subunit
MPKTASAIQSFLGSGAIKGVGEVLAGRIVDMFGEATLEVIENDIESLARIKGITKKKAKQISDFVNLQMGIKKFIDYFNSFGLMPVVAVRAYKVFGLDTIKSLNENPFLLCELGLYIPFEKADSVAQKLGFEKQCYARIRAGILFCLTHYFSNGHTFLPRNWLFEVAMVL